MRLDIWSDLVCPYCSIGNAELERALADFEHRDDVEIRWRSFELDPDAPVDPQTDVVTKIAEKYGMSTEQSRAAQEKIGERSAELGLPYDWAAARWGNTFDAHRVAHLADDRGVGHDVSGRLLRAYFSEGRQLSDHDTLTELAGESGVDEAEVRAVLNSDAYAGAVRDDERMARELGITSVPTFVLAERFGVVGAQSADVLLDALRQAWAATHEVSGT